MFQPTATNAGVYNTSLPTLSNGQQSQVQLDSSGRQIIAQATASALNATVTQGTAAAASGAWTAKVTDGTNTATVKAASTAPVAGDPALVVAISPNSVGTLFVSVNSSIGVANAPVYNAYGTTSVTTAAYVQLIASTTATCSYLDIFDSSGQAMILATGGAGSEVILCYVPPGGDQIRVQIPASTRVAYKALTANATTGYLLLNLWK